MAEILNIENKSLTLQFNKIVQDNLGKKITETKYLGGGSNGRAFRLVLSDGEKIVFKIYRFKGMNEAEAKQLKILSENTDVPMPKVLFTFANEEICAMAMTFINGKNVLNPVFLLKSKNQKQEFANSVIKGMLKWHDVSQNKFGDLDCPQFDTWHELYRENKVNEILRGIEQLTKENKFGGKKFDILCRATEIFDKCETDSSPAVLIHGDLNIMNIMAKPATLELTGFIDPCGSMWADREYDLFQLQNMWGNSFFLYETYKKLSGKASKESDFRVAYYGTMNEVSCRLNGGPVFPLWEDLWFGRLTAQMKKFK